MHIRALTRVLTPAVAGLLLAGALVSVEATGSPAAAACAPSEVTATTAVSVPAVKAVKVATERARITGRYKGRYGARVTLVARGGVVEKTATWTVCPSGATGAATSASASNRGPMTKHRNYLRRGKTKAAALKAAKAAAKQGRTKLARQMIASRTTDDYRFFQALWERTYQALYGTRIVYYTLRTVDGVNRVSLESAPASPAMMSLAPAPGALRPSASYRGVSEALEFTVPRYEVFDQAAVSWPCLTKAASWPAGFRTYGGTPSFSAAGTSSSSAGSISAFAVDFAQSKAADEADRDPEGWFLTSTWYTPFGAATEVPKPAVMVPSTVSLLCFEQDGSDTPVGGNAATPPGKFTIQSIFLNQERGVPHESVIAIY